MEDWGGLWKGRKITRKGEKSWVRDDVDPENRKLRDRCFKKVKGEDLESEAESCFGAAWQRGALGRIATKKAGSTGGYNKNARGEC